MKNLTGFLSDKGYLFSKFTKIEPKQLQSRKKIDIYSATTIKSHYISIFIVNQKSRFLIKHVQDLLQLQQKLISYEDHNFKKNILIISSPICSKALKSLKEYKWIVYNDFM